MVADIQRTSYHDGPGFRTTVFFKGCPLRCEWCHNPECIAFEAQALYYPEKCIHCGKCESGCFSGARTVCGREMSADELLCEILSDKDYYGKDGGVTFSGGEPLAQKAFLSEITDRCLENGVKCAVETSLIYFYKDLLSKLSLVMADLKIWDSNTHKVYTGIPNDTILHNFALLDEIGVPVYMRTPVIPDIDQQIDKISGFAKGLRNVVKYELLPYHPLGLSKAAALGAVQKEFTLPSKELMEELKNKYAFIR